MSIALSRAGYTVDWSHDGHEADIALHDQIYEAVILDLGLPRIDGFEVLKRMRSRKITAPVIILTARDDLDDRVRGLDLGADDYLTKPFALGELEARVRALARRLSGAPARTRCGSLELDRVGQRILREGEAMELTRAEYMVLGVLLERAGKVVAKTVLFDQIYEWNSDASQNAIETFVSRIRRKIEGSGVKIRTVRGLGYLIESVSADAPGEAAHGR